MGPLIFSISLILFVVQSGYGQIYEVSGKVSDSVTNAPLAFVNIIINGGKEGSCSDIDGIFHLKSKVPINYITLSYVGYEKKIVQIQSVTKDLRIRLAPKQKELEEVLILPKENPANRIINNVIENSDRNNPGIAFYLC